jgi:hypothetical protein
MPSASKPCLSAPSCVSFATLEQLAPATPSHAYAHQTRSPLAVMLSFGALLSALLQDEPLEPLLRALARLRSGPPGRWRGRPEA